MPSSEVDRADGPTVNKRRLSVGFALKDGVKGDKRKSTSMAAAVFMEANDDEAEKKERRKSKIYDNVVVEIASLDPTASMKKRLSISDASTASKRARKTQ